jgi:hypothetical protein
MKRRFYTDDESVPSNGINNLADTFIADPVVPADQLTNFSQTTYSVRAFGSVGETKQCWRKSSLAQSFVVTLLSALAFNRVSLQHIHPSFQLDLVQGQCNFHKVFRKSC